MKKEVVMDEFIDIPAELYADDVVCFIANRYHVTASEVVRCFWAQCGMGLPDNAGGTFAFSLEANEVEIMKGLVAAYGSVNDEECKYI